MAFSEQLLEHPFSMILSGPSQSGKTVFCKKLLEHLEQLSTIAPKEIYWYYGEYQPVYQEIAQQNEKIRFICGEPNLAQLQENCHNPRLIIMDDLMSSIKKESAIQIFTQGVHHWNMSVVFIMQNLFFSGQRTARINTKYLVLFKNPADRSQVSTLARQMYPGNAKKMVEAYTDATKQKYTYLFVDLSQGCPEELRLRTNIFPGEIMIVYT